MHSFRYVLARDEQPQHAVLFAQAGGPVCLKRENGPRSSVSCPPIALESHFIAPLSAPGLDPSVYWSPNFSSKPTLRSIPSP